MLFKIVTPKVHYSCVLFASSSSVSYCPEGSTTVGSNNLVIPTPDSFSETSSNHLNMRRNISPNLYPSQTRTQVSFKEKAIYW